MLNRAEQGQNSIEKLNDINTGILALEVVLSLKGLESMVSAKVREYGITGKNLTPEELLLIGKVSGLKIKRKRIGVLDLAGHYPFPAICRYENGNYVVLLGVKESEEKVLILELPKLQAETRNLNDFSQDIEEYIFVMKNCPMSKEAEFGFRWFFNEISKYSGIITEVLLGSFVVQIFGIVTPLFTQVIIDKVLVHNSIPTLQVMGIAFLIVALFEFLLNVSRNYIFIHTTNKIDAKLGAKIFKHLLRLYYVYFENRPVGNIILRVRELDRIREFITEKSVSLIIDTVFSAVFIIVMLLYSTKLTIIALIYVLVLGLLYILITPELRNRLDEKFRLSSKQNSYLVETITGIQTVKSMSLEGSFYRKWEEKLGEYLNSSFKLSIFGKVTGSLSQVLQKLMTITILYIGVMEVISGRLTIGQLIAFQMIAGQFSSPMLRLLNLWNEFQQALLSVERIGEILNSPKEHQSGKAIRLLKLTGAIKIENLSFRYNVDGPKVLQNVNLEIQPGMRIGIVGRSGSGKSTIAKLIQRLYYATEGTIYIDGIDIRNLDPMWLRSKIGVVLQENYLFSGSIRENIALPNPSVPMERIIEVAKESGAHEFISKLPHGYDTEVGERGSTLSGGQKQRIAIARALITNPRILIFDEATSALDYESERIIRDNMERISKGRTMLIIAHRLSTIKDCDQIVCFENGQIVEVGTHSQLLNQDGYYKKLYESQSN